MGLKSEDESFRLGVPLRWIHLNCGLLAALY